MIDRLPGMDGIRTRHRQGGVSLIVVLIALLIMGLAAAALLRSSDTGTLITGNLAFQQTALASGDAATEAAVTWLAASAAGTTLESDSTADGYYASTMDACDLTTTRTSAAADDVNWTGLDPGASCNMVALTPATQPAGVAANFKVRYVINRVCNAAGDPLALYAADGITPMNCSRLGVGASEGSTRGGPSYGNTPLSGESQQYYRITVRVDGPRNSVRYIQTLVVI